MEERVQRPVSHFVQAQIVLLLGIGMLGQHVELRQRRADDIVHDAAQLADFIDVIKLADLHDIVLVFHASRHATRLHLEAGCIGHDGLLEADLRTVGKAGDHGRILLPLFRESPSGWWDCGRDPAGP